MKTMYGDRLKVVAWALACVSACSTALIAVAAPASRNEMPGAREVLGERAADLDREVAQRLLRKPQTGAERMRRLDLEIDLRLTARWMFAQGLAQKETNETQINARLKGELCLEATALLEQALDRQREKPTAGQVEGMERLHRLTYTLADGKGGNIDAAGREVASAVILIAGGSAADVKALPPMRPRAVRERPEDGAATGKRTAVQMAEILPHMTISVPLRQQLMLLAEAAMKGPDRERPAAAAVLESAFDLAAALQNNVGVSPEARVQMEGQLAEGVALYLDARTREGGRGRIAGLSEYGRIVDRIAALKLTAEEAARYAPLFTWAREQGEGVRALASLERFVQNRRRGEARAKLPTNPIQTLRRSIEELEKQYRQGLEGFNTAYDELIRSGGATGAATLESKANEMGAALDLLEKLDAMPAALDRLAALKPRPFGGLERRIAAGAAAAVGNTPQKGEGAKFVHDVHRLSELVAELTGASAIKLSGGSLPLLEGTWKGIASDLANAAAGGGEVDAAKLNRLAVAKELYDALRSAAELEAAIGTAGALYRWVDWRMNAEPLSAVFDPYREALSDAAASFVADGERPLEPWRKTERQYRRLVEMVLRSRGYADQVQALPGGLTGVAASLATPCEGAPFGVQRLVSFGVAVGRQGAPGASEFLVRRVNE